MSRSTIFISHATPEDNDFVRWLTDRLTGYGYDVWIDLDHLKGGTPFWVSIEDLLRNRAAKVIFVVSKHSVDLSRANVRNEIALADVMRRTLDDAGFIIPVRIDDTPFSSMPIQLLQLHALDFSKDRDSGLTSLLATLPGRKENAPATTAVATGNSRRAGNLASYWVECVARETEIETLAALVRRQRMVSVQGPGGVGKTTLALAVAAQVFTEFSDGVWVVDLASVAENGDVTSRLIETIGVSAIDGSEVAGLLDALARQSVLLLLDNCEHVVAQVAAIADELLSAAPGLKILATTQVPLGIGREHIYKLAPFDLGDAGAGVGGLDTPSARFLAHCYEAQGETLREDELPEVAQLCRRLDGVALALKMAAAQAAMIGVETVDRQLPGRLDLGGEGSVPTSGRHGSLTASMEWSYALLSEASKFALRSLSVFSGSFNLEGTRALVGTAADEAVADLVRRSIIMRDRADRSRYRLLETTRHFALARLAETGDEPEARHRHASYVRDLFRRGLDTWETTPDRLWLEQHQPDSANLRAALDWAASCGKWNVFALLAAAGYRFWIQVHLPPEMKRTCQTALAQFPQMDEETSALIHLGLAEYVGFLEERAGLDRTVDYFRRAGDNERLAQALMLEGERSRYEETHATFSEVGTLTAAMPPSKLKARALCEVGMDLWSLGERDAGRGKIEAGLAMHAEFGNDLGLLVSTILAGETFFGGDDYEAAARIMETIPVGMLESTDPMTAAVAIANHASYLMAVGRIEEARPLVAGAATKMPTQDKEFRLSAVQGVVEIMAHDGMTETAALLLGYLDAEFATTTRGARQRTERGQRERIVDRLNGLGVSGETLDLALKRGATLSQYEAERLAGLTSR